MCLNKTVNTAIGLHSQIITTVTNAVSVLPATPHCKTNQPVHPHFKSKSGLVDSAGGYIRSDATRRRSLGAAAPSSLLSGAGHLAAEGSVLRPKK